MLAPVVAQPVNVLLDGVHVFYVFLGGVGVIHAQMAFAAKLFRHAEVDAQRLGVTDMQVAVGLGGKTGLDGAAMAAAALRELLADDVFDEIAGFRRFDCFFRHGYGTPVLEAAGGLYFL